MMNDPKFRREVKVATVVAILVLVFIQPVLHLAESAILWAGANVFEGISNAVYHQAASGLHEESSVFLCTFVIAGVCGLLSGLVTGMYYGSTRFVTAIAEFAEGSIERARPPKRGIIVAIALVLNVALLFLVASTFAAMQLNTSFNQRLAALAPRITDQQFKEFKARWALMEKRSDYLSIVADMDKLAKDFGFKLPRTL